MKPRRTAALVRVLACAALLAIPLAAQAPRAAPEAVPAHPARGERVALSPPFATDEGRAFVAAAPAGWPSDGLQAEASRLVLLEEDRPLGPAHALHADIRERGGGRFSHWNGTLLFSTSDNSDPNSNGRRYAIEWRGRAGLGEDLHDPLPLFDAFAHLPATPPAEADGPSAPALDATASETAAPGRPWTIWWYTIDALRADVPFALRDGVEVMPALAAFAREQSVAFDRAYAHASFTKTSTASMFTGLWPQRHRVMHGVLPVWPGDSALFFDLDRRFDTLAGVLLRHGFDTWTHLYTVHVRRGDGMLAGFRHTDLDPDAAAPLPLPAGPLFAYEHILGVHGPYRPSAAARERLSLPPASRLDPAGTAWFTADLDAEGAAELWNAYLGEAADADLRFAARVKWLRDNGLWDGALLIVTADHGEAFLEHGLTQHSTTLHEEMVRVPLFVKFPAESPYAALHGRSFPHRVSHADLFPTLLELVGAAPPAYALDGRSLLPILSGEEADPLARDVLLRCSNTASGEAGGGSALFLGDAVLSGSLKALFGYQSQSSQDRARHPFAQGDWIARLHDLGADPAEQDNLAPARPEDFLRLMERARLAGQPLRPAGSAPQPPLPALNGDELQRLRELGYVR